MVARVAVACRVVGGGLVFRDLADDFAGEPGQVLGRGSARSDPQPRGPHPFQALPRAPDDAAAQHPAQLPRNPPKPLPKMLKGGHPIVRSVSGGPGWGTLPHEMG